MSLINENGDNEVHPKNQDEKVTICPWNLNNVLINKYQLEQLLTMYGIKTSINNVEYYHEAFSHKSYCKKDLRPDVKLAEHPESCLPLRDTSNERLEFLGDSIIGAVVAHYLYERYPNQDEGFMTRLKIKLVNGETLAFFSKLLHFNKYILISRHVEDRCNGRESIKILEDCFEAFIGALYVDFCNNYSFDWIINYIEALEKRVHILEKKINLEDMGTGFRFKDIRRDIMKKFFYGPGYNVVQTFIINIIEEYIDFGELILNNTNFKDILLRYFQQTFQITPKYQLISHEGQHHERVFRMSVLDKHGDVLTVGEGKTKKKAEQEASKKALIYYGVIEK